MINRMTIFSALISGGAYCIGSSNTLAQTIGAEYTTELQTDLKGAFDWLNLLKTSAEIPIASTLAFEASTLSIAKTADSPLAEDLLTYSNIEAGNIPFTLARAGFNFTFGNSQLFGGINNVNEDYFTSDLTAFFTNSSCGISPTISCNFDIANYPLASWCVHYGHKLNWLSFQTSLYPGKAFYRLAGHDNLFGMNIKRDGIFSISSIDYNRNGTYIVLGVALHYGKCMGDEYGEQIQTETSSASAPKRLSASPWLLTEVNLPFNIQLLAHNSISTVRYGCKDFVGVGAIYSGAKIRPGISFNYASFSYTNEYDLELTARIPLVDDHIFLQPAVHLIGTDGRSTQCVALMRCVIEWSNR